MPRTSIDTDTMTMKKSPSFGMNELLQGRSNWMAYSLFFNRFAPLLEKKSLWKQRITSAKSDADLLSISSEAFGLLVLENQWDRWMDMYEMSGGQVLLTKARLKQFESKVRPLYTRGGVVYDSSAEEDSIGTMKGWSSRGIQRFNELCDFVAQDRKDNRGFVKQWLKTYTLPSRNAAGVKKHPAIRAATSYGTWSLDDDEEKGLENNRNKQKQEQLKRKIEEEQPGEESGEEN